MTYGSVRHRIRRRPAWSAEPQLLDGHSFATGEWFRGRIDKYLGSSTRLEERTAAAQAFELLVLTYRADTREARLTTSLGGDQTQLDKESVMIKLGKVSEQTKGGKKIGPREPNGLPAPV